MRAWLEIDLDIISSNFEIIKDKIGKDVEVIAVVKSDAYGHGIRPITSLLDRKGVNSFAVISLEEARVVRSISDKPVLIMGYLNTKEISEAIEEGFVLSLYDNELAAVYERLSQRLGKKARVHLKVETGLNRLGLSIEQSANLLIAQRHFPHISIEAIFSHLANSTNRQANMAQLRKIQDLILAIQGKCELLPIHLVNSGALPIFSEGYFDAVRVGLALYGVDDQALSGIKPCLRCKSVVMQVKPVKMGEGISYDHLFIAQKDMTIAVVAIGYGEGYTQAFTGSAEVLIRGRRARVLGKICMNLIISDVTGIDVKRGEEVVLIGDQASPDGQRDSIKVSELAKWSGLRHHEIILRLGTVLPKQYLGG